MKNNRIKNITRIVLVICGLALIAVIFTPIWRIDLQAPQYPEGLRMLIYANKLAGDVEIINGLNHYIGMKTLHANDFVEFTVLPGIIAFFAAAFIFVGLWGRRKALNILLTVFILFGILAMYDFWRWEYDYGHNLNPEAAIIVPGMAYQPPLIGFKQLLNFGAWSFPDIGGFIFIGVGVLVLLCSIYEWRNFKKMKLLSRGKIAIAIITTSILLSSCSVGPQEIKYGKDNCHFCKMTISDNRFATEIVTKKSKIYKFDDSHCLIEFLHSNAVKEEDMSGIYFTNFSEPHDFLSAKDAILFKSEGLKSPMGGNTAAFNNQDSLTIVKGVHDGNVISWEELKK